jgi:hypothetical protein
VRRTIIVILVLCGIAAAILGSVKAVEHYEDAGRSPYEKVEDERE